MKQDLINKKTNLEESISAMVKTSLSQYFGLANALCVTTAEATPSVQLRVA